MGANRTIGSEDGFGIGTTRKVKVSIGLTERVFSDGIWGWIGWLEDKERDVASACTEVFILNGSGGRSGRET